MTWQPTYAAEEAAYHRQLSNHYAGLTIPTASDINAHSNAGSAGNEALCMPNMSSSSSSTSEATTLQSPVFSSLHSNGLYSHGQLFDCSPVGGKSWQSEHNEGAYVSGMNTNYYGHSTLFATPPPIVGLDKGQSPKFDSDPPSPLRAVSPDKKRNLRHRRASDGQVGEGTSQYYRRVTWNAGPDEGPNVSPEQKARELRELQALAAGGPGSHKERRRIQNRFAQRAFRARSKLKNSKDMTRLEHLEEVSESNVELVKSLRHAIHVRDDEIMRLQTENAALKSAQWTGYGVA